MSEAQLRTWEGAERTLSARLAKFIFTLIERSLYIAAVVFAVGVATNRSIIAEGITYFVLFSVLSIGFHPYIGSVVDFLTARYANQKRFYIKAISVVCIVLLTTAAFAISIATTSVLIVAAQTELGHPNPRVP